MTYARKIDSNHGVIVQTFREMGCSIRSLAGVGEGVPDLLIGCSGYNLLVEVKDGSKPPSKRKLTTDQVTFKEMWRGSILYVDKVDDVVTIVNAMRKRAP